MLVMLWWPGIVLFLVSLIRFNILLPKSIHVLSAHDLYLESSRNRWDFESSRSWKDNAQMELFQKPGVWMARTPDPILAQKPMLCCSATHFCFVCVIEVHSMHQKIMET